MSHRNDFTCSRRFFVRQTGLVAGGVLLGTSGAAALAEDAPAAPIDLLPQRVLGRTGVSVTTMTLGTAPCGFAKGVEPPRIAKIVNAAIDEGINSIDTAPAYIKAEEGVGLALGKRRKDVFLATKVMANSVEEAEKKLSKSFGLLKTDYFDLVYYHSLGNLVIKGAMKPDGVFTWLAKQKKAGKFRFLGVSGHNLPGRFPQFLETGEVDVLLTVVNFVDRHTYRFEDDVLPIARKHNIGVVAMKVLGGARKNTGSYENPDSPCELDVAHVELATRYALSIPGVTTLNLGAHNIEQVRRNAAMVRNFKPLSDEEMAQALSLGEKLAADWGPHFGPVKEERPVDGIA